MPTGASGSGHRAWSGGGGRDDAVTENAAELTDLVVAARSGDPQAVDALIAAHLPLLYRIVGRALNGHADVDDVVQETVLRAHRDLPTLHSPESFRSWLVAIAMHQISSRLRSWQHERDRVAPLSDAAEIPDPQAEFADVTLLRLGLSEQRRQVTEAARWLDPDDRELLTLWLHELAGDSTRADVVTALGISPAHARVRLQRMRRQLELSRSLVAALDAVPRCPGLDAVAEGWDGMPSPRWRKRFARHLRDCPRCGAVRSGFVPVERLLVGASMIPVPAAVGSIATGGVLAGAGAATGTTGAGVAGWLGSLAGVKLGVAAAVVGVTVSGGVYLALPDNPPSAPRAVASPPARPATETPAARATTTPARPTRAPVVPPVASAHPSLSPSTPAILTSGPAVIRFAAHPDSAVILGVDDSVLQAGVTPTVVELIPGLADPACISMRAADGRYVRHRLFKFVLNTDDGKPLFLKDATFCPHPGARAGTVRLSSLNYPDRFVRVLDGQMKLDPAEDTPKYVEDSTFMLVRP